jgi:hypothetical protein
MSDIYLSEAVFRLIREQRTAIVDCLQYNGVKTMEHYREMMGMMTALDHIEQELKSLLDKQEQLND